MLKVKQGRSVFLNYLVSNLLIVLLTCTIIGLAQILYFLSALTKINNQILQNKMDLILQDMNTQWDELTNIATNIQVNRQFNPHIMTGKYSDIELLEEFCKYTNNSVYSEQYFLLYHNSDSVYQCDGRRTVKGNVMSFRYYCQYVLGYEDNTDLYRKLCSVDKAQIIQLSKAEGNLLTFPIHTTGKDDPAGDATLCFLVTPANFVNRAQTVSGVLNGEYALYYQDQLIAGKDYASDSNLLSMTDADGNFRMLTDPEQFMFEHDFFKLTGLNCGVMMALLLTLLIIAGILAYYNYRPIRQVFSKYVFSRINKYGLPTSNELKEIDSTLKQILDSNQSINEQLRDKIVLLKSQILRLVLKGEYSSVVQRRLEMINVNLPGPYFCVLEAVLSNTHDESVQAMLPLIEDLSDEDFHIYAIENDLQNGITILVSLSEQDYKADIYDNVIALCEAENKHVQVAAGRICKSLQTVHISYLDAQSAILHPDAWSEDDKKSVSLRTGFPMDCNLSVVDRFINAVTIGDDSSLMEKMDEIDMYLRQNEYSELRLKYLFTDISSRLIRTAGSLNIGLDDQHVSLILCARSIDEFMTGLRELTHTILQLNNSLIHEDNLFARRRAKEIHRYIQEHATDYYISLDSIAEHFNISVSYVGRLIKSVSGRNFKEYLIQLRMEEAKKLLSGTNLSVSEICQKVGYTNNSNFIKNFKREAGVTPMNYKKLTEDEKTC